MDAAHWVYGAFLGVLWSVSRLFIRTPSGRKRFNVLGALDAITHELILMTNTVTINAVSVCGLLKRIRQRYGDTPVTLILDNARYQYCKVVKERAAELGIELLFLPPYSPNLNLIERVWKWVKRQVLYSKYYASFDEFQRAITTCLDHATTLYKTDLDSLLTLRFQTLQMNQL